MEKEYKCSNCAYCNPTNSFFMRWCNLYNKVTYLTSGCYRETTILDYDYDDDFDDDDD